MSKDIEKLIETLESNVSNVCAHEYTWYLEDHPGDRMCRMDERDLYVNINNRLVFVKASEHEKTYRVRIKPDLNSQTILTEFCQDDFPVYTNRMLDLYNRLSLIDEKNKQEKERRRNEEEKIRKEQEIERHKQNINKIVGELF